MTSHRRRRSLRGSCARGALDEADIINQDKRLTAVKCSRESSARCGRDTAQRSMPWQHSCKETPVLPWPEKESLFGYDQAGKAGDAPAAATAARQLSQAVRGNVAHELTKLRTVLVHQVGGRLKDWRRVIGLVSAFVDWLRRLVYSVVALLPEFKII